MGLKLWSGATGAGTGTSWTDAYTSLAALYAAEGAGAVIDMATDHVDPDIYWDSTAANSSDGAPFRIRSTNRTNDQYDIATAPQFSVSGSSGFNMSQFVNVIAGGFMRSVTGAGLGRYDRANKYRDMRFEKPASGTYRAEYTFSGYKVELRNIDLVNLNAVYDFRVIMNPDEIIATDIMASGFGRPGYGFIQMPSVNVVARYFGIDVSAVTYSPALFELSTWSEASVDLVVEGAKLRSGMTPLLNEIPASFSIRATFSNMDKGDGSLVAEVYARSGKMTTSAATYKTTGYQHHQTSQSQSRKIAATANCNDARPFEAQPILCSVDTAGYHEFTVDLLEDYTSALTTGDLFLRIEYPAAGGLRAITDVALAPATQLAVGAGTGAWTNPPGGARSAKVTGSAVLGAAGVVKVTPVLARYEAGKSVWYDPKVTVA